MIGCEASDASKGVQKLLERGVGSPVANRDSRAAPDRGVGPLTSRRTVP